MHGYIPLLLALMLGVSAGQAHADSETLPLSLQECVARGVEGSRRLELLRIQLASASTDVMRASAVYDTRLRLDGSWQDSELPPGSIPTPGGFERGQATALLAREFSTGTRLGIELDTQRNLFEGTEPGAEPSWRTSASLQFSQSLWKNAFGSADRARVAYARMQVEVLESEYRRAREEVAAAVADAYWAAWIARQVADAQDTVVARLGELRETYRGRVEDGLLDETALLGVDASLAVAEVDAEVLRFEALARDEELKERIDLPPHRWDMVAIDYRAPDNADPAPPDLSFHDVYTTALEQRADIEALRREEERVGELIRLRGLEDRSDVTVSGSVGRGDADTDQGETWDFDRTIWSIGIAADISLARSVTRADLEQAFLAAEDIRVRRDQLERVIALDARSAVRQVTTAARLVRATAKALDLQTRKLAAEEERFDRGQSDVKTVLDYRNERDLAQRDFFKAAGGYRRALLALDLVQGAPAAEAMP